MIESAEKATELAVSFIKQHYFISRPLKAIRENNTWNIEIDVGLLKTEIVAVKIDAGKEYGDGSLFRHIYQHCNNLYHIVKPLIELLGVRPLKNILFC